MVIQGKLSLDPTFGLARVEMKTFEKSKKERRERK
jgi:hypothetical protein